MDTTNENVSEVSKAAEAPAPAQDRLRTDSTAPQADESDVPVYEATLRSPVPGDEGSAPPTKPFDPLEGRLLSSPLA